MSGAASNPPPVPSTPPTSSEEMTVAAGRGRGRSGRLAQWVTAIWGAVAGATPHVLHHVGPLAGAAVLAGVGGRVLFFVVGLGVAAPMLVRLYRRFRSWVAPAVAISLFAITYTVSSLFVAPLISGGASGSAEPSSETTTPHDHDH